MTLKVVMAMDEISLLEDEFIQLTVRSSLIKPKGNKTSISSVWTKKIFNPDSFREQMKSIWKASKKF